MLNELDIWINSEGVYIGHDNEAIEINVEFLIENSKYLILHIKGLELISKKAIRNFSSLMEHCHIFAHQEDKFTITNRGWIWSHPKAGIVANTICVMPENFISIDSEFFKKESKKLKGICTDYPLRMLSFRK